MQELENHRQCEKWFYIRYHDPHPHLRLRVHVEDPASRPAVKLAIEKVLQSIIKEQHAIRWCTDSYQREIVRYGGNDGIRICEDIFFEDSVFAISCLKLLKSKTKQVERYQLFDFLLSNFHYYFNDFELDLESRISLLNSMRNGYKKRFPKSNKEYKSAFAASYRAKSEFFTKLVNGADVLRPEWGNGSTSSIDKSGAPRSEPKKLILREFNQTDREHFLVHSSYEREPASYKVDGI